MSYSISVSGHIADEGEGSAAEREQAVVDAAREGLKNLEGVSSASFYGQHVGTVDLLADQTPAETEAAEVATGLGPKSTDTSGANGDDTDAPANT